jgi:hypothetical protein
MLKYGSKRKKLKQPARVESALSFMVGRQGVEPGTY